MLNQFTTCMVFVARIHCIKDTLLLYHTFKDLLLECMHMYNDSLDRGRAGPQIPNHETRQ